MNPTIEILAETEAILSGERTMCAGRPTYWIKRHLTDGFGGFCLLGALYEAGSQLKQKDVNGAISACTNVLDEVKSYGYTPGNFNDSVDTKLEDVLALLRTARERVAARERAADPLEQIPTLASEPKSRPVIYA